MQNAECRMMNGIQSRGVSARFPGRHAPARRGVHPSFCILHSSFSIYASVHAAARLMVFNAMWVTIDGTMRWVR
jgi:hypothetical protein